MVVPYEFEDGLQLLENLQLKQFWVWQLPAAVQNKQQNKNDAARIGNWKRVQSPETGSNELTRFGSCGNSNLAGNVEPPTAAATIFCTNWYLFIKAKRKEYQVEKQTHCYMIRKRKHEKKKEQEMKQIKKGQKT